MSKYDSEYVSIYESVCESCDRLATCPSLKKTGSAGWLKQQSDGMMKSDSGFLGLE